MLMVPNEDQRPKDYEGSTMDKFPRPSHADFTYHMKYGIHASSGGGRSSARETIGRVAAGAVAEKYLTLVHGVEIVAFVSEVGSEQLFPRTVEHSLLTTNPHFRRLLETITREEVDTYLPVRCPNTEASQRMAELIANSRDDKDSIGGTVTCVIRNSPAGLGEPCFNKLEAKLSQAMLSIPATKAFEIGSGREAGEIPGSLQNDAFIRANPMPSKGGSPLPTLTTTSNTSGGIQGGISNGAPIYFQVHFKSAATIGKAQTTAMWDMEEGVLEAKGRHDPCIVPRAVPIVEAMAALVIMDALLVQKARESASRELDLLEEKEKSRANGTVH